MTSKPKSHHFLFHNTGSRVRKAEQEKRLADLRACHPLTLLCRIEESLDALLRSFFKLIFMYTYF